MRKCVMFPLIGMVLLVFTASAQAADIITAAKDGDVETVRSILSKEPEKIHAVGQTGHTALHWAGIRAQWDVFQFLMDYGPDVNAVGGDGGAPLHWSCHHDRPDMIKLLLDRGADLNIQNQWGRTPLHCAVRRGCKKVVALLLEKGADPEATTKEGWTSLHVAYRSGHKDIIDLLISKGFSEDVKDKEGRTPSDMYVERPAPISIDPKLHEEYVGEYFVGKNFSFKVWEENGRLYILDFAADVIYPIDKDVFFCEHEPWRVTFIRDEDDKVCKIEVEFIRRKVTGIKPVD